MDKQQLVDALKAKFYKVLVPGRQRDEDGISWYLVGVYDKKGDAMVRQNLSFYVEKEGTEDEAAYWATNEPKPDPKPTTGFVAEVNDYIVARTEDETFAECQVVRVNEMTKTAFVTVLESQNDNIVSGSILIRVDSNGKLYHDAIGVTA